MPHPLKSTIALALALFATLLAGAWPASAQTSGLTSVFQQIRNDTLWPVDGSTFDSITSTFGPRIRVSTSAYDWHRGLDINAPLGTPVRAVLNGTFFGIQNYTDGGLTVILRHTFPHSVSYKGRDLTFFYTFYMHLSSVDPALAAADAAGATPPVERGAQIGSVGHSGSAVDDHLHLELRVGTPYSLEWQLANPTSVYGANAYGFDPHVHPMWLFVPYPNSGMSLTLLKKPLKTDGTVRYTSDDDQPLLNRVLVQIKRKSDGRIVATHTLDFNERIGYDASTNVALDTVDTSKPYMSPLPFGSASPYATNIVIPKVFVGSSYGSKFLTTVTVYDIWGVSRSISW